MGVGWACFRESKKTNALEAQSARGREAGAGQKVTECSAEGRDLTHV